MNESFSTIMTNNLNHSYTRSIKCIICCFFFAGFTTVPFAQNVESTLSKQFDTYRSSALQEKIFVHTDKEFYLAGEICWFKLYTVDAFFHKSIDISKVAYVELLDNTNKPILQAKIELKEGDGNGSLYIPVTIHSGNFKLRVYTSWMKNFSPDYFFEKSISVINTQQIVEQPLSQSKTAYDVQFFPEGGNLVNGLQSKIAFRVVDQYGTGVNCNAVLLNNNKDTVARFQAFKFGMGNFMLKPVTGQNYSAVITMPNGAKVIKELPAAFNDGYVMSLTPADGKQLKVVVQSIAIQASSPPTSVFLFVHTRGSVKAAVSAGIENGVATFLINTDQLGIGISHFTVFNSERKPVCERLYFRHPAANLNVSIKSEQVAYNLRQKINLAGTAADQFSRPLAAKLSMSVYRVDSLQLPAESGISEYLWLTSDLPGNIESPEYYFNTSGQETAEAMENLLLTNGWRRFRWEEVLQDRKPLFKFAPEYNGHLLTGKIVNLKAGGNVAGIPAFLSVPGTTRFRSSRSDEKGNVKFEIKNYYGAPGIIVQTNFERDSFCRVEIDNPFSGSYSTKSLPPFVMPVKNPQTLLDQSIGMQVENIYNGEMRKRMREDMIDTSRFYEHPNEIYLLDNYTRFATMEEVLREYIFPVNVRKREGRYHLPVYNDADVFNGTFEMDPLVLLDGVPVFNMDKLIQYDPLKVHKLEAVTRQYYYGDMSFYGIVNIVTNQGDLDGYELDPTATVIDYEALQLEREFYSPVYETPQQVGSHLPDFRNVLSWAPVIRTGKDGKFQHSFYSSDLPGKYVAEVQALTTDGKTGSARIFFEVKAGKK